MTETYTKSYLISFLIREMQNNGLPYYYTFTQMSEINRQLTSSSEISQKPELEW